MTHYSRDNGHSWRLVENYVRNCAWVRDHHLDADVNEIICESYRDKTGNQQYFTDSNPLELVTGTNFFAKKRKVFENVVGFAKFSQYLVVAEVCGFCRLLWRIFMLTSVQGDT